MAQTAYSVNGQVITPQSQKMLMDLFEKRGVTSAEQRLELAKQVLTQQAVINQLAAKNRLEIDPAIKAELEETKSQIFLNELLRREVFVNPITDYEFKKEYEMLKESYDPNEVKVSHILVKTNSEAKEIIRRIRAGEDFTKLAKELSLDPTTKDNGGQMDFTNVRQISINGFGEAAHGYGKGIPPSQYRSRVCMDTTWSNFLTSEKSLSLHLKPSNLDWKEVSFNRGLKSLSIKKLQRRR